MPAFPAEFGMPVRVDLVSAAPRKSERFYRDLLGWEYAKDEGDAARRVARLSGMPVSVLIDGGAMAVIADPSGALVGLLEQAGGQAFLTAGEPGAPVWFELLAGATAGFDEVVEFYHELFGWDITVRTRTDSGSYAIANAIGAPFAGLVAGAGYTGWIAYLGVLSVDQAVKRTQELGGEVIVGVQDTEFGPLATIADPAGATTVLCEVPPPPEEELRESDPLEGIDLSMFKQG